VSVVSFALKQWKPRQQPRPTTLRGGIEKISRLEITNSPVTAQVTSQEVNICEVHNPHLYDLADSGFKRRANGREKFVAVEWFVEESDGSRVEGGNTINLRSVAGEENYPRRRRGFAQS
jgi:hypothetical protein